MSFIRTGLRELGLKVRRQRTRLWLRHEKRLLQRAEIALGREGTEQAANFPELRQEIVALKKLEQEQKEVAREIARIEEAVVKIEQDRQSNSSEREEALAKLEAERKPVLQQRDEAKNWADTCERELAGVDQRIEANDTADRNLLKELSELQAMTPPPADLDGRSTSIGAKRARLPEERAELVRARMGSADACRLAKEKLTAAEAELSAINKTIEKAGGEYESRDKSFADNVKSQQDAMKQLRERIQTVEERKNPAYLNIGRHLASQGIAPPNAPQLLTQVRTHREAVDRHLAHTEELALLSAKIDKQELRRFYFCVTSVIALAIIILPLVSKSPPRREWLPNQTEAILSLNLERLDRDDLPKRWRKEQPDVWASVWSGLIGNAGRAPALNIARDTARITRALTTDNDRTREFILIENRSDVSPTVRAVAQDKEFERKTISGLPVWQRSDLALARVGPAMLAVGTESEVDELVRVRLGMERDLQLSGEAFERFQSLDRESTLRLISRDPGDLPHVFHPVFANELLDRAQMIGVALSLQNPVRAHLLVRMASAEDASRFARELHDEPQRWLRMQDSDMLLYAQAPDITRRDANIELRFVVPENSARLLLQRLAKSDTGAVVAEREPSTP